jgi:hypothetical protein
VDWHSPAEVVFCTLIPYLKNITLMSRSLFVLLFAVSVLASCKKENNNKVPTVDAGPAQSITLPINTVTVTGTGSDEDGDVEAYLWSQVSGPAASIIVNPGSPSTVINGLQQGTYVFQLMVTDDMGATGVDTTSIVVNPAQIKTLTLQPTNNPGEYHLAVLNGVDQVTGGGGGGPRPDVPVSAWTVGGSLNLTRELIKFDLSAIPANSTIISANLYLYTHPAPVPNGNFIDANFGPTNTMLVQQVTSNWAPASTSWYNQPTYTTTNQVVVPHTTQSQLDLNLDVKNMVASMVNGNANYGFVLRLQTETIYNSRIFVSSKSTNAAFAPKFPKLVVVYQ